jgi:hypothetical protein
VKDLRQNVKCKAFDHILRELNNNPVNKWLIDKRLTILEKKIIEGYVMIRNNQNMKAFEHLSGLAESDIGFVNAHKDFILGMSCNNLSKFLDAQVYFRKAVNEFEKLELDFYLFSVRFNLFLLYSNLNHLTEMKSTLDIMSQMHLANNTHRNRLLRCQFIWAYESNDVPSALLLINKISKIKKQFVESDAISQLVTEFMFFVQNENLIEARKSLDQMKAFRKFNLSENYNFMKKLLAHLTDNSPVYVYDKDFQEVPVLLHQLKVIQSLESRDLLDAEKNWLLLHRLYPSTYRESFEYMGNKCLFSLCLNKHLSKKESCFEVDGAEDLSKSELLMALITNSETPLLKDTIYENLWGTPPVDKDDLKKLARLVSKVRSVYGVDIQSRKGTYFIALEQKINKAS